MKNPAPYADALWIFTILLAGRVAGQLVVAWRAPRWLPPMEQWQSGLVRYPVLVFWQGVVLALMTWTSADFTRGAGFWMAPPAGMGTTATSIAYGYFTAMVVRYAVRMRRRPDQRWLGGTIPIMFHSVVAAFLWTFGTYHAG
jgi:uncharacterized protein